MWMHIVVERAFRYRFHDQVPNDESIGKTVLTYAQQTRSINS